MLVSILIPCYNAERWIAQAIESALAQTWPEKEVIVVDDGSTDGSLAIIRTFEGRIRWESGPNRGGNPTRNRLLELARGEWLQYLDADDYLLPDKLTQQVDFLGSQSGTDVLYGHVTKEDWTPSGVSRDVQQIPEPHDPWILLVRWYLPQTGGPLWRKAALEAVGGWKPDQPCCQEHELYLRLLMAERRFDYCPLNGAVYRVWSKDTVCHRDERRVRQRRLEITRRAEDFLRERGELTAARRQAVNQSRFQMARLAWPQDHAEAVQIVEELRRSDPHFRPLGNQPGSHHPPLSYRLLWSLLGFRWTETIGDWSRRFRQWAPFHPASPSVPRSTAVNQGVSP
jgi:glycosyltransferase involved in cell wall biosynthesis